MSDARERGSRGKRAAWAALLACVITPGVLTWTWSRPAAVPPVDMPPLVLDPAAVRAQLEADGVAAAAAPDDDERARLYRASNVAEAEGAEPPSAARERHEALLAALRALAVEHGEDVVAALRARDLERAEAALRGALPAGERVAELGGFVGSMERYGLARNGRQVAPRFVVRVVFEARWNAIHGRPLTDGMSAIEREAYWGWLAIRGDAAPIARRLAALEEYARAGGERAEEIRGVLLYEEGRVDEARAAFEAAYAEHPSFRLRNHALACSAGGG